MIIGIAGSFAAGKGTVVDYLKEKGFAHYQAREFITEEILRQGLPVNRDSMIKVANDLRALHGPVYIIESLYAKAIQGGTDAIIESIREVAGVRFIKEQGGVVLGVDAEPHLRYERGSATDAVTFEKWQAQEKAESNPNDPTKQDIFGALKESDFIITNNGTVEELRAQVDTFLSAIN
jgi:dephospho-CoA kinase